MCRRLPILFLCSIFSEFVGRHHARISRLSACCVAIEVGQKTAQRTMATEAAPASYNYWVSTCMMLLIGAYLGMNNLMTSVFDELGFNALTGEFEISSDGERPPHGPSRTRPVVSF